jgi:cyclophilin family peptidyl-prolyl cis-trans isomerase
MNKVYALIIVVIILSGIYYVLPKSPKVSDTNTSVTDNYSSTTPVLNDNASSTPNTASTTVPSSDVSKDKPASTTPITKPIIKKNFMNTVTIETNKGTIVFETYDTDAPKTVENFITLAKKGYYNGIIFHRVIKDFMIQGGDPNGNGTGGPGYTFADELNPNTESYKTGYVRGMVAMANAGPNTNGSQFFIMHKDYPLPHNYTIFGRVISGIEVVDAIANAPRDAFDKPLEKIVMNKVNVKGSI